MQSFITSQLQEMGIIGLHISRRLTQDTYGLIQKVCKQLQLPRNETGCPNNGNRFGLHRGIKVEASPPPSKGFPAEILLMQTGTLHKRLLDSGILRVLAMQQLLVDRESGAHKYLPPGQTQAGS